MSKHWFKFKGTDSRDLNLHIERTPPIVIPSKRYTSIQIPGRDGDLHVNDDVYNDYQRQLEVIIRDFTVIDRVLSLFTGTGWLTISDEPDKRYWATVIEQAETERIIREYRRLLVIFNCYPFKYEAYPQILEIRESGYTVYPKGTRFAQPKIQITGTGNVLVKIQDHAFKLNGTNALQPVTIDSQIQECYFDNRTTANNHMEGEYPTIDITKPCTISWEGNISQVTMQPGWRWF